MAKFMNMFWIIGESLGFDSQDEAIEWLSEHLIGQGANMFEKAFEEYKKLPKWKGKIFMKDEETCFKDGLEFGYNKGLSDQLVHKQYQLNQLRKVNEWHYVKDKKIPKFDEGTEFKFLKSRFMKAKRIVIFLCGDDDFQKVIAWKEIVSPKED